MSNLRKKWIFASMVLLIIAAGWIYFSAPGQDGTTEGNTPAPHEGFLAPDFALQTIMGETIRMSDYKDRVVVLNLWATWCPPCRAEMPALQAVSESYDENELVVLTVNMTQQDSVEAVETFIQEYEITSPVPLDLTGEVAAKYQLRALPTTFFIGYGNIIHKVVIGGPIPESLLRTEIEVMMGEAD